jgi:hypothetical protein
MSGYQLDVQKKLKIKSKSEKLTPHLMDQKKIIVFIIGISNT